ncbi:MAG: extracellular solute-binding protein [Tyzzerella sp.]|nr:extracellular solute-binding protein [Tyzzerella sp.]
MKKSNTWKKIVSLCLCLMLVLSMVACGNKEDDENKDGGKLNKQTDDSVVDMGGYEFTIASPFLLEDPDLSEVTAAEAIFEEVRHKVEEDYNCTIKVLALDNTVENVRTKILAGDKIADIIHVQGYELIQMARAGYIVPLETVDGLNLEDERYVQGYINLTEFNGQHYGLNFFRPAEARVCMIYNRDLIKKYGLEDPQELMKSGKWTFDKFREMCKAATRDTNGDGTNDTYGCYVTHPETFGMSMIAANGGKIVTSEGGVAKEAYNDPKALASLNFIYDLVQTDKTIAYPTAQGDLGQEKEAISRFTAGEYLFYECETFVLNQMLKPIAGDLDYGLLSIPMGPEATEYISPSENACNYCITSTNKDVDKTVIILNALARYMSEYGEGKDWWHYDLEMDYFQEGDDASVEVYLQLLDNATFDLGVGVTDLWTAMKRSVVWDACFQNKGTPASRLDAIAGKYQTSVDAVYN